MMFPLSARSRGPGGGTALSSGWEARRGSAYPLEDAVEESWRIRGDWRKGALSARQCRTPGCHPGGASREATSGVHSSAIAELRHAFGTSLREPGHAGFALGRDDIVRLAGERRRSGCASRRALPRRLVLDLAHVRLLGAEGQQEQLAETAILIVLHADPHLRMAPGRAQAAEQAIPEAE